MNMHSSDFSNKIFDAFAATSKSRYIFICNMWTDVSRWSKSAVDFFGLPGEYMEGAAGIWEQHVHPEDRKRYREAINLVFTGKERNFDMEYRAKDKNGNYVVCSGSGVVIDDDEGRPSYFAGTITNHGIIDNVDPTTNLYNLYEFLHALKLAKDRAMKMRVLLVGFKHFSDVNDVYGYAVGNDVMRQFGSELRELVASRGEVYRMDGSKFAICTCEMNVEEIKKLYADIKDIARNNLMVSGSHIPLDTCAGAVVVEDFKADEQAVLATARYALDSSKNEKYGELVIVYNDADDTNKRNVSLIHELRNSILNGCKEFYICYQPVVSAKTGKLTGMEALIRWNKEPYGDVPPGIFIPMLEKDAIFFELGNWILRQVMLDGKEFLRDRPELTINVNISYTQLEHSEFRSRIVSMLANTGFPPEHLCLELTERCSFLNMDFLKNEVSFLKSYGIKIALDDFGTGFSSLNLLREIQVDCIKIDREFVKEIETNVIDQTIVRAVVQCANDLDVPVCIEGIENDDLLRYMNQYAVSGYQGYLYSRPIIKEDFKKLKLYKIKK